MQSYNSWNAKFQDVFETLKRLFIIVFSVCMTVLLRSDHNSNYAPACYDRLDALWHFELRVVSSTQIDNIENHHGDNWYRKKMNKEMDEIYFWLTP